MNRKRAVLSLILIALMSSQWFALSHLWMVGTVTPIISKHAGHSAHGSSSSTVTPLQHSCCEQNDGALNSHGELCCGACPALPSIIADFTPSILYLSLRVVEPHEQSFVFLASLWHPPTL